MKRSLRVFSRHPSHKVLRNAKLFLPKLTLIRLGSTTKGGLGYQCEINSISGVNNSANKLLMKQCFEKAGCKTAPWWKWNGNFVDARTNKNTSTQELPFPLVAKGIFGSRGRSNYLLYTHSELTDWMKGKDLAGYIFEKFQPYNREYRLHVTEEGCFYTCRKMLRTDCPDKERWHRHEDNCVWITENNAAFDKPKNWDLIVADCVKGLKAIGLDVCSFDVKVQSCKNKEGERVDNPDWFLLESNSGSSFGTITAKKYIEQIPKIYAYKMK